MTQKTIVTCDELVEGFRTLGIEPGDVTISHSSLSSFGRVEGGADTVIEAMSEAVSSGGTVVFPTLAQRDIDRRFELWDIETTPSDVGRITEIARLREDSIRSDHPTHSVCAIGPKAREITDGHADACGRPSPWGPAAFGYGSPWEKFHQLNALHCFLGVTMRVNTMRHYIQSLLCESVLAGAREPEEAADGLQGWQKKGVWPHYDGEAMQERLTKQGLITEVQIGKATCCSIRAQEMVQAILAILRSEPDAWFKDDFLKWYHYYFTDSEEH